MVKRVDLIGLEQAALIVQAPTGVLYENQTCGISCLQESLEGVLIPITNEPPLADFVEASYTMQLRKLTEGLPEIDDRVASEIDRLLASISSSEVVTVNRHRLQDSHEAWVFVQVQAPGDANGSIHPEHQRLTGILTWPNSH